MQRAENYTYTVYAQYVYNNILGYIIPTVFLTEKFKRKTRGGINNEVFVERRLEDSKSRKRNDRRRMRHRRRNVFLGKLIRAFGNMIA